MDAEGKNWRNGVHDIGPAETERTRLPETWVAIRAGRTGMWIGSGPVIFPLLYGEPEPDLPTVPF